MSSIDTSQGNTSMSSHNEDSVSSIIARVSQQLPPLTPSITPSPSPAQSRRHHVQNFTNLNQRQTIIPPTPAPVVVPVEDNLVDERDKHSFYRDLYSFHETRG